MGNERSVNYRMDDGWKHGYVYNRWIICFIDIIKMTDSQINNPVDKFIISEMMMAFIDGYHGKTHESYACGEKDENGMRNVLALLINKGWKQP